METERFIERSVVDEDREQGENVEEVSLVQLVKIQ